MTDKIETLEDFLERMKNQIGLIIWQFLFFRYSSPQSRSDICEGSGLAWTTIHDALVRLSEWGLVESQSISTGKRRRSKVYW